MKKLISLILSLSLTLSLSISAFAAGPSFLDVPVNHWAYQYVERAADEGWVAGVGGGKFNPDGQVTGVSGTRWWPVHSTAIRSLTRRIPASGTATSGMAPTCRWVWTTCSMPTLRLISTQLLPSVL